MIDYDAYLREIGVSSVAAGRVAELVERFKTISGDDVSDIFITDSVNQNSEREFKSLWLFSKNYISEIKDFVSSNEIDFVSATSGAIHVEMNYGNTDLTSFKPNSNVMVVASLGVALRMALEASGNNCPYLMKIIQNYILTPDFLN